MTLASFFAMGGYAVYVWSSYAFAAVVLAVNVVIPLRRHKAVVRKLRRFLRPGARDPS